MNPVNPWLTRAAILAALAILIPACGHTHEEPGAGGGGPPPPPPPPPGPVTLLTEAFGTYPNADWTGPTTTGNGVAAQDAVTGDPAPSLAMTTTNRPGSASTQTVLDFAAVALTISARISVSPAFRGTGTLALVETAGSTVVASAAWDSNAGTVAFNINGAVVVAAAPAADGAFHTFQFRVDGAGNSSWSVDGNPPVTTGIGFPAGNAAVRLSTDFGAAGGANIPTFRFDNVLVTTP